MTPPWQPLQRNKKVEFSPSLSSIDSEAPDAPPRAWDSETDHLLSYFLGGGEHSTSASSLPDFADTISTQRKPPPGTLPPPVIRPRVPPRSSANRNVMVAHSSSNGGDRGDTKMDDTEDEASQTEDEVAPPPTPATQFYAPHSAASSSSPLKYYGSGPLPPTADNSGGSNHQHYHPRPPAATSTSNSSSNSSLSSMTAAFVSGGPLLFSHMPYPPNSNLANAAATSGESTGEGVGQHHPQQLQQPAATSKQVQPGANSPLQYISPISPAAMIGNSGHENLMLPPPPRPALDAQQQHEQHLAWLRDINAQAQQGLTTEQLHHQQLMQQQFQQHHAMYPYLYGSLLHSTPKVEESEEKRAKRLERNRESARRSRRKKKERLQTLEAQVRKLQNTIEQVRQRDIIRMVQNLMVQGRQEGLVMVMQQHEPEEQILPLLRNTGSCSTASHAILDFQYMTLKQTLLPRYQKYWLWLALQSEQFFVAGKEEYERREQPDMDKARTAMSGRISSKQIGDDLTKQDKTQPVGPTLPGRGDSKDDQGGPTSFAHDAARIWPLFCFEMSFSVEQEEKLLQTFRKNCNDEAMPQLPDSRAQTLAALDTSVNLREAMESLRKRVTEREERTLGHVLSAAQLQRYQAWLSDATNRERGRLLLEPSAMNVMMTLPTDTAVEAAANRDAATLFDICRKLQQVLQISTGDSGHD